MLESRHELNHYKRNTNQHNILLHLVQLCETLQIAGHQQHEPGFTAHEKYRATRPLLFSDTESWVIRKAGRGRGFNCLVCHTITLIELAYGRTSIPRVRKPCRALP
jgi:hypothetical protein